MTLALTSQERVLLAELLTEALGDLKAEIYHTEGHDYKLALKAQSRTLRGLIEKLGQARQPQPV